MTSETAMRIARKLESPEFRAMYANRSGTSLDQGMVELEAEWIEKNVLGNGIDICECPLCVASRGTGGTYVYK